jgi:hypothetical protein
MSKVLRAFDYSFDGITALKANVGDDIDFRDMTVGLAAEGYIELGAPVPQTAQVDDVVSAADEDLADPVEPEPAPTEPAKRAKRR